MSLALSSAWFRPGAGVTAIEAGLREIGLPRLHLDAPDPAQRGWREPLTEAGLSVVSVGADPAVGACDAGDRFAAALATATAVASALKSRAVVVEGGRFPGQTGARLADLERTLRRAARGSGDGAGDAAQKAREELLRLRGAAREKLVETAARALHAAVKDGVPLAVRNGDGADALLAFEETGWLLDALPRLGLWFDPARAERAARLGTGPALTRWTDAFAARTAGVFAHGLGSDLAGRAHPEDAGPDWGSLGDTLPRGLTWVLDLSGTLSAADVRDAVRFLTASGAVGRTASGRRPQ